MSLTFRAAKPWSIQRLESLKPGESFRYYQGDMERDSKDNPESPQYAALIKDLWQTSLRLEAKGRIKIVTKPVMLRVEGIAGTIKATDYIATGVALK